MIKQRVFASWGLQLFSKKFLMVKHKYRNPSIRIASYLNY